MSRVDLGERSQTLELIVPSPRSGVSPKTRALLPHRQLDQFPPPEVFHRLTGLCQRTPGIGFQESRFGGPDTLALWPTGDSVRGPAEAFIDDHEFCHIQPLPEGSVHLTLPHDVARRAIEFGWAEPHILARTGFMPRTLVMVYAPRDEQELETVWRLIMASFYFASGG